MYVRIFIPAKVNLVSVDDLAPTGARLSVDKIKYWTNTYIQDKCCKGLRSAAACLNGQQMCIYRMQNVSQPQL